MTAVPGMFDVEVDQAGERADHQIRGVPRRGGRLRVNDQEAAHSPQASRRLSWRAGAAPDLEDGCGRWQRGRADSEPAAPGAAPAPRAPAAPKQPAPAHNGPANQPGTGPDSRREARASRAPLAAGRMAGRGRSGDRGRGPGRGGRLRRHLDRGRAVLPVGQRDRAHPDRPRHGRRARRDRGEPGQGQAVEPHPGRPDAAVHHHRGITLLRAPSRMGRARPGARGHLPGRAARPRPACGSQPARWTSRRSRAA